jgi:hypothetical protein
MASPDHARLLVPQKDLETLFKVCENYVKWPQKMAYKRIAYGGYFVSNLEVTRK